jgi:hypothetical protein
VARNRRREKVYLPEGPGLSTDSASLAAIGPANEADLLLVFTLLAQIRPARLRIYVERPLEAVEATRE